MIYTKLKDIICPTCKKTFHPRYSGRKFCSRECFNNSSIIQLECDYCGKRFFRNKSYIRCKHNFCSKECAYNGHDKRKKTYLRCKECGIKFYSGHKNARFCSRECYFKWFKGKNASNWQGGKSSDYDKFKQSKEYKEWRTKVFKRDNYTCQDCGFKNGNGKHRDLHPHHIKSASKYLKLRLKVSNGITLCKNCHGKRHSINFKNRKYQKI